MKVMSGTRYARSFPRREAACGREGSGPRGRRHRQGPRPSEDKAKKLVERLKGGSKLEDLATEAGATVQTVQGLKRNESNDTFSAAAVAALFATPENGFAYAVEPDGRGAKVMQSQAVLLPAFDPNSPQVKQVKERLQQQASADVLAAYLSALQSEAGVTVNETLWRQISGTAQ